MVTNQEYLIQLYAEAQEGRSYRKFANPEWSDGYWKGRMDLARTVLDSAFPGWERVGTVGYYVYHENQTYDAALASMERYRNGQTIVNNF
jgi:hypothetical protein